MDLTILVVVTVIFLIIFFWFRQTDPRLPPCPMRPLPLVGHLLYMTSDTRSQFRQWRIRCGDIFSVNIAGSLVVVLNGYDVIREAFVKHADKFSDRPHYFIDEVTQMKNTGIILCNGDNWKEQRNVSLSILRAFGMGKNLLAEKIQEEVDCYMKYLANLHGKPSDIFSITNISVSNIICSILIGRRFEYDDEDFLNFLGKLISVAADQENVSLLIFIFWLRHIPGDPFKAKRIASNILALQNLMKKFVNEKSRPTSDIDGVCNFIDAYRAERNKRFQAGLLTYLDDKNLLKTVFDLFIAGTETVNTTIYWCILYMVHEPELQEKLYQEIKQKVGTDRAPAVQDKSQLAYVNAVIMETQRLASIVPLSLAHVCLQETTLRGYTLPKGTYILPNLDSVLHDSTTWGNDAMSFRPERFIDDNGKLKTPKQFIPYSIGHRVCLGEAMAKMELFLFISALFQKFKFLPANSGLLPSLNYHCGLIAHPQRYQVKLVERENR